ncbi:MAG: putative molybdenum carrier protein [Candidatus Hydrogenedentota bacterium]
MSLPKKIVSGGQTGVDRAALDVAMRLGIPCGGWCPKGRFAEDGRIPPTYPLIETPAREYAERTCWNVRDSDGTLILTFGEPAGGTALTRVFALQEHKPHLVIDLETKPTVTGAHRWINNHNIAVLNVAGPRASTVPGIYPLATQFLETLFAELGAR